PRKVQAAGPATENFQSSSHVSGFGRATTDRCLWTVRLLKGRVQRGIRSKSSRLRLRYSSAAISSSTSLSCFTIGSGRLASGLWLCVSETYCRAAYRRARPATWLRRIVSPYSSKHGLGENVHHDAYADSR